MSAAVASNIIGPAVLVSPSEKITRRKNTRSCASQVTIAASPISINFCKVSEAGARKQQQQIRNVLLKKILGTVT